MKTYLVTGGAGFIGSNFILMQRRHTPIRIVNLDLLTYAGNPKNLESLQNESNYIFIRGDIEDRGLVRDLLTKYEPCAVLNFAAESHVDRSIDGPEDFIQTNVVGTFHLLDEVRRYWMDLPVAEKESFRFLHISTDEVYGSLEPEDQAFNKQTPYAPNIVPILPQRPPATISCGPIIIPMDYQPLPQTVRITTAQGNFLRN